MPLARTTISIEQTVRERFFRAYPVGKRSQIIQTLIERDLSSQTDHLARIVLMVDNDPAFAMVRQDMELWERTTAGDGLTCARE